MMKQKVANNIAIELKNYSFSYNEEQEILSNCSMTLKYGEFALLSGISGEGKSTLASAITGIIPHSINGQSSGEILVDGQPIADLRITDIARKVGYVLQNPDSQIFHSKVADEIAFGCENLNMNPAEIDERINHVCSLLELNPEASTKHLSGGQKQRLMMACILAMGQKILLLDEPLANLDLAGSNLLLKILKDLCAKGYAVLLIEHRLDVVMPHVDRVFVLENGAVKESEKQVLTNDYFRKLLGKSESANPKETLVTLKNLSYKVKNFEILKDISFSVHKGERIVILGENGSGKTTLLRQIAGLLKPTTGFINTVFPVKRGSRAWFRTVGYIYQEPSYQLFMPSVREEIAYGADPEWAERCLEIFGLQELSNRHPHSLSEGQQRRLSIAAVSATTPQLLLLDEPTVGQDFDHLDILVQNLNDLHSETNNTMITITHDYRCAEALADRVIWIKNGVIFSDGDKSVIDKYFLQSSAV